jgi:hypothetical protein
MTRSEIQVSEGVSYYRSPATELEMTEEEETEC